MQVKVSQTEQAGDEKNVNIPVSSDLWKRVRLKAMAEDRLVRDVVSELLRGYVRGQNHVPTQS